MNFDYDPKQMRKVWLVILTIMGLLLAGVVSLIVWAVGQI